MSRLILTSVEHEVVDIHDRLSEVVHVHVAHVAVLGLRNPLRVTTVIHRNLQHKGF